MKRLLVLLCVAVVLVEALGGSGIHVVTASPGCYDTDGGKNIWEKGRINLASKVLLPAGNPYSDYCSALWPNLLAEKLCKTIENEKGHNINMGWEWIVDCGIFGATCQDGRCVKLSPTPTPEPIPVPTPEPKSAVGYVTIQGSTGTSMLIAKQWNGNEWQYPQYMTPENLDPPGPWSVDYILNIGVARFGLFERGTDHEQDQNPIWTTEVEVVAGKRLVITVYDEKL